MNTIAATLYVQTNKHPRNQLLFNFMAAAAAATTETTDNPASCHCDNATW